MDFTKSTVIKKKNVNGQKISTCQLKILQESLRFHVGFGDESLATLK
jgi:hypothetical protein